MARSPANSYPTDLPRRGLLVRAASIFGISAALLPVLPAPRQANAYNPGQTERRARYQPDSPDVQAFYRTNGYESLKK